jgi:hypothetical protein
VNPWPEALVVAGSVLLGTQALGAQEARVGPAG